MNLRRFVPESPLEFRTAPVGTGTKEGSRALPPRSRTLTPQPAARPRARQATQPEPESDPRHKEEAGGDAASRERRAARRWRVQLAPEDGGRWTARVRDVTQSRARQNGCRRSAAAAVHHAPLALVQFFADSHDLSLLERALKASGAQIWVLSALITTTRVLTPCVYVGRPMLRPSQSPRHSPRGYCEPSAAWCAAPPRPWTPRRHRGKAMGYAQTVRPRAREPPPARPCAGCVGCAAAADRRGLGSAEGRGWRHEGRE